MLLRDLWSQKLDWDDIVSKEIQILWSALSRDLAKLDSLQFPRFVISEDGLADFYTLCEASFAVYSVQNSESHLLFSKAKVAPMKPKSLPTLELLAVFFGYQVFTASVERSEM